MTYIWQRTCWPRLTWKVDQLINVLADTRFLQGRLISKIESLGLNLDREAQAEILVEDAVKTSAIEGQLLDEKSVRSSVARQLGLPAAGLPAPDRRADGLVELLLDAAVHHDKPLTVKRIKAWHAVLFPTGFSGMHRVRVGAWRGRAPMKVVSGPVGRETIHFEAPPNDRLNNEMKSFLAWWKQSSTTIDGLLRAGVAHFYFVTIHPFEDGNGRIARAITDMALAQDEHLEKRFYSLSSQIMTEREAYYDILERTQRGDCSITPWLLWFLGCTSRAITASEGLIAKVLQKAVFWRIHAATAINDRQRKAVNLLLDKGPGTFEGSLTTRKYVSLTKTSRATAYRELSDLESKGMIRAAAGRGRSVGYDLVWPDVV